MPHEADSATRGRWSGVGDAPGDSAALGDDLGVYAVHGVLLRTGRVLLFSGRVENAAYLYRSWTFDPTGWEPPADPPAVEGRWFLSRFDPGGANASPPGPPPRWSNDPTIDLFCAHHVVLEDGRVLVVGGAGGQSEGDARGNRAVYTYDPVAERWDKGPHLLQRGRWYPTAVTLPDGRFAVFSGRQQASKNIEPTAEVLGLPALQPAIVSGGDRPLYIYPGMVLVRGGRIFYVPTAWLYEDANTTADVLAGEGPTASFRFTAATQGVWTNYTEPGDPSQPLRPTTPYREEGSFVLLPPAQAGRVLVVGGGFPHDSLGTGTQDPAARLASCEILETQGAAPRWVPAGNMHLGRSNVHVVVLPDGKVLILGGHDGVKRNHANDQNRAELFDPTVPYDAANPTAAFTQVAEMHASRNYHAVALLLPDARVLVAGGEDNQHHGGNQTSLEVYEPPYCHNGARPDIVDVRETSGPDDRIAYGGEFLVEYSHTDPVARVVLMRPAAPTHHTDTEQRHVPLNFVTEAPGLLRVTVVDDPSVAPPGWYMLFLLDAAGRPCNRAVFLQLSHRRCLLVTDRSTLSSHEVEATGGAVPHALYVFVDGFLPSELGVTTAMPSPAQLAAWAPAVTFHEGAAQELRVAATPTELHVEDATLPPGRRQRFAFEYSVHVTDMAAFPVPPADVRELEARSEHLGYRCRGRVRLTRQPNPYLLDGPVHWLSTDLRVFKIRAGETRFGVTLDAASPDPHAFLGSVLDAFDANSALVSHPFTSISEDQATSRLQIATTEGATPVFNFAIARVRYRALTQQATDVRMFFRLFATAVTNFDFDVATTYRRHSSATGTVPLLGIRGTEVVTLPFFAAPRVDTTAVSLGTQTDPRNVKTLPANPSGAEVRRYFGAWLDFNRPERRFPRHPGPNDGPYAPADAVSITELVHGRHQCLVAELEFPPDPTPPLANPATDDNLSQRNLAIEGSDNPGGRPSHIVPLTFDITPTWSVRSAQGELGGQRDLPIVVGAAGGLEPRAGRRANVDAPLGERTGTATAGTVAEHEDETAHGEHVVVQPLPLGDRLAATDFVAAEPVGVGHTPREHEHKVPPRFRWLTPDELMVQWGEVPREATASLYVPSLSSQHMLELARLRDPIPRFEAVDPHTVRFVVGDVTYLPLPVLTPENVAALLTLELPDHVRSGEQYRVVVKQVSHLEQRVVGTFELRVPVSTGPNLLVGAADDWAVMRWIADRHPAEDRWRPVLDRYLGVLAGRVRGFGGDPDAIKPSPSGSGMAHPDQQPCAPDPCPRGPSLGDVFGAVGRLCPPLSKLVGLACRISHELGRSCIGYTKPRPPHDESGHHH